MDKSFWIGCHLGDFLFQGYTVSTVWGLLATCLGVASLSILYEGGRIYKLTLKSKIHYITDVEAENDSSYGSESHLASYSGNSFYSKFSRVNSYALTSVGHDIIGYILMLSVMTMNVGLVFAIWLGAGIGYFFFAADLIPTVSFRNTIVCENKDEKITESGSHEDFSSISECQREVLIGESSGMTGERQENQNASREETNDLPKRQEAQNASGEEINDLSKEWPTVTSQGNIISQAVVHSEPFQ